MLQTTQQTIPALYVMDTTQRLTVEDALERHAYHAVYHFCSRQCRAAFDAAIRDTGFLACMDTPADLIALEVCSECSIPLQ